VTLVGSTLIAWAGIYLYVAIYSSTLALSRPKQSEHRSFAGYSACLALFSFAGALSWEAHDPAEGAFAQSLQMVALFPAVAFFVHLVLRLCERHSPALVRATTGLAIVAMMAAAAGLFYDPAYAEASYQWAAGAHRVRAAAKMSLLGIGLNVAVAGAGVYAFAQLVGAARRRSELRVAALLTSLTVVAGLVDVTLRALRFDASVHVTTHGALLSVLGFSYVLLGRFTSVEQQLEHRKEELARSYDYLRATQEEIVKTEQLAAVGELSAVIAHEVRNPLAIIKNAVSGLRREELRPDDGETLLSILDEETDRLDRLVDDLLAYARPISPHTGKVDMPKLVGHAVELAAGGSRDISHIELELELDRPCDPVEGDQALLRHALINIVDNALQAMPNGGILTVSCRNVSADQLPHVAVEFHDTGEGMDTLVRSRARDPFFTTRHGGTGLGLAIVDRVARAHGGRVEIESRHGQGTTVSFVIPRDARSI